VRGAPEPSVRPDGGADRVVRMLAHLDTGAELDAVGENLVPHMELHVGVLPPLSVPQLILWSDKNVVRESCAIITMRIDISVDVLCARSSRFTWFLGRPIILSLAGLP